MNVHLSIAPMSPRARTVSDEQIIEAALRCIVREGPDALTLAGVARQAGVSAPTLVQRFGSKRGLLLAVAGAGAPAEDALFASARSGRSPLEALLYVAERSARALARPPEALANHL